MSKNLLKLILLSLIFLFGNGFFLSPTYAAGGLNLATIQECGFKYSGDNCIGKLKAFNNTDYILEGIAFLHIEYQGECSNNQEVNFDGEGIEARFSIIDNNWLNFSDTWENGTTAVSGFKIAKGETYPKLKIETHPALCPGEYTFTLTIKGTAEGEEHITSPVVVGGGGGYYAPPTAPITNTGKVVTTPGEGGIASLTNPDGSKIELIVPAGAVSKNTIFTIKKVGTNLITPPNPEIGLFLVNGLIYEIKAQRDEEFITTFNKPLILTFHYTDKQMEGLDENSLQIYYWDNGQKRWIVVGNSQVDEGNNTVTTSVDHLTIFALMGSKIGFAEEKAKKGEKPAEIGISGRVKEIPKRITEKIKKITERITPSAPTAKAEKPSVPEEVALPEKKTVPAVGKAPQRGLGSMFASLGMAWQGISQSVLLSALLIICLLLLALLFLREYKLFRKKRKMQ